MCPPRVSLDLISPYISHDLESPDAELNSPLTQVIPHLFISALPSSIPDHITHVLDVGSRFQLQPDDEKKHMRVPIRAHNPAQAWSSIIRFIDDALAEAPVPAPSSPASHQTLLPTTLQTPVAARPSVILGVPSSSASTLVSKPVTQREDGPDTSASTSSLPTTGEQPKPRHNNVLVYSQTGQDRAAVAILAYLCYLSGSSTVEAFFFLRNTKKDITPSPACLVQIDKLFGRSERYQDTPDREIARLVKQAHDFDGVMGKMKEDDWMFEEGA